MRFIILQKQSEEDCIIFRAKELIYAFITHKSILYLRKRYLYTQ